MNRTFWRVMSGVSYIAITMMALTFVTVMLLNTKYSDSPAPAVISAAACVAAYLMLMRGPLGQALRRALEDAPHESTAFMTGSHDAIDVAGYDVDARMRIAELEERLDFAERLLSQRDPTAHLPQHHTPV